MGTASRAVLALSLLLISTVPAAAQQASIRTEVPAGKWRALRVRNVPKGALLGVSVKLAGSIDVYVVYGRRGEQAPERATSVFRGVAVDGLSFSITVPASADYYVVLDNRKGEEPRQVDVTIRARRPRRDGTEPTPPDRRPGPGGRPDHGAGRPDDRTL